MKPKFIPCLALVSLTGLTVFADSNIFRLQPANIGNTPFTIKVSEADFGKHFTVFYQTNGYDLDEFVHAQLDISTANQQIASSSIEKIWATNGVRFEFAVSTTCLSDSKFTITELGHSGKMPMPSVDAYWFYLHDFVSNRPPTIPKMNSINSDSGH